MLPHDFFRSRAFRWFSFLLIGLFFVSCLYRVSVNPSGPHVQRQIDTAGSTLSLALIYQKEGWQATAEAFLFPRLLARGLTSGINITEFPLLNVLTFPLFVVGTRFGIVLSTLLITLLAFLTGGIALPRLWKGWGAELPASLGLLAYFSMNAVAFHSSIYMPEAVSFPLLVWGTALFCTPAPQRSKMTWFLALICTTLALAVKPLAMVGLLIPALWPFIQKPFKQKTEWAKYNGLLAMTLVLPIWWYKIHGPEIVKAAGEVGSYSGLILVLGKIDPLARLSLFSPLEMIQLMLRQMSFQHFPAFTGLIWFAVAFFYEPILSAGVLVMLLGAMSLLGPSIWGHEYYFFGVSLMSLLIIGKILYSHCTQKWIAAFAAVSLLWGTLYSMRTNVWIAEREPDLWGMTNKLLPLIPNDAVVVTDDACCTRKLLGSNRPGTAAPENITEICRSPGYSKLKIAYLIEEINYHKELEKKSSCIKEAVFVAKADDPQAEGHDSWVLLVSKAQP